MNPSDFKHGYTTIVTQAEKGVPGFGQSYAKFREKTTLEQCSKGLITNYGRSVALVALHFGRSPETISVDEINTFLYRQLTSETGTLNYFKHAVFGLRFWFRMFNMEDKAISMPPVKKNVSLPVVLSKTECKLLFKAPHNLKHKFLLAFAYAHGLRMNELRLMKISDVDTSRKQVLIKGKGNKKRCVGLSKLIAEKLAGYLAAVKPQVYLFEGNTPAQPMGERSIQYIITEAHAKTEIPKAVSMHTLRHSYATHLLEDGIDIHTIQHLLGHADLVTTMVYLHVAQVRTKPAHSPLDSLYYKIEGVQ